MLESGTAWMFSEEENAVNYMFLAREQSGSYKKLWMISFKILI